MWNFAFPILVVIGIICFVVFVVWPKVKNSKWGEKKFDEMVSPGRVQNTTSDLIDGIKDAKDGQVVLVEMLFSQANISALLVKLLKF
jgi:hypothetical protein